MIDKLLQSKYITPLMIWLAIIGVILTLVEGFSNGKWRVGGFGEDLFMLAIGYAFGRIAKKLHQQ